MRLRLYGQDGTDRLAGGAGLDRLNGGSGNDVYDFDAPSESRPGSANRDVILAFDGIGGSDGDRIDLSTVDAITDLAGNQAFAFRAVVQTITGPGQVQLIPQGADSLIQANTGGSLAPELGRRRLHPIATEGALRRPLPDLVGHASAARPRCMTALHRANAAPAPRQFPTREY